jgi:hypothetical protein
MDLINFKEMSGQQIENIVDLGLKVKGNHEKFSN